MIPGLGVPTRTQLVIGAIAGAMACLAELFRVDGPGGTHLSLVPAILMMAEITGGWAAAAIGILALTGASLLWKAQAIAVLFATALVAAGCARALRAGLPPLVSVLLLAVVMLLEPLGARGISATTGSGAIVTVILVASFNVVAVTILMMLLPRRSRWFPPQRRWRLEDALFVLGTTGLVPVAVILFITSDPSTNNVADPVAIPLAVVTLLVQLAALLAGLISRRAARRLATTMASRQSVARDVGRANLRYLPLEVARLVLAARRASDFLRRQATRQGLHLESAKRRVGRLQKGVQSMERVMREKDLALTSAQAANGTIEGRWRAFLETVPDALIIADGAGRIEFANGGLRQLLGHEPAKLIGTPLRALVPASRDGADPFELGGPPPENGPERPARESDVRFRDAQGATRELAARVEAYYFQGDRHLGIRLRDVSGLRYVVQELKQARKAAGSTQRARDQFIATMSHEIRTPLHGLMATLDMLRSESFTADGRHRLSIARTSAKTLISIANDILDLSRINAGGMALERKPMSLERLVTEVADEARARAESLHLDVHVRMLGRLPASVMGDPARIKQILRNLLGNALKFTSSGSVTVQASYTAGECIIDVTDTGQGVSADKRESIFEPFVQADDASSRRFGGAGLGLPISRKLSEAMSGSLSLLQSGRTGSTFRLTLPLQVSDEPPVEEQSQRILQMVQGRILVVEDDEASQYVAQTLLESLQCPARIAANGSVALELIRSEEFDLVLMDCEMPEMDGYETTRRIRQMLRQHIPIIAMTAATMASDRQRCFDAGMDDVLPKPFAKSALNDVLCKWLSPQPSANDERTLGERVAALPALDMLVYEELRESLHWQLPPLRKIYASFRESAHETVAVVSTPGASAELAGRRLHSLQGSAGLVGARQIEHLAAWLTQALKEKKQQEQAEALPLLRESLRRFEQELDGRVETISGR
jgi:PAS domain S-box-containing protein